MLTRHFSRCLAAHLDGQLPQPEAQWIELHLRRCGDCRAEYEQVRWGMAILEHLPRVEAPDAIWPSIESALQGNRSRRSPAVSQWRLAFAAAVVLALSGAAYWRLVHPPGIRWEVAPIEGSPSVSQKPMRGAGRIGAGEWIETDAVSRASVKVGEIGSIEIAPNTRVRVVTARSSEHRLALTRGEIRAKISAPPKLFFVDTASATAVDFGCVYALSADEEGFGWLHVTRGWVSFQW